MDAPASCLHSRLVNRENAEPPQLHCPTCGALWSHLPMDFTGEFIFQYQRVGTHTTH